jgi:hypothetical protein
VVSRMLLRDGIFSTISATRLLRSAKGIVKRRTWCEEGGRRTSIRCMADAVRYTPPLTMPFSTTAALLLPRFAQRAGTPLAEALSRLIPAHLAGIIDAPTINAAHELPSTTRFTNLDAPRVLGST